MKTRTRCSGLFALALTLLLAGGSAEQVLAQAAAQNPATSVSPSGSIRFRPKTTGAISVRVTGGSRGTGDAAVTLDVLAPDDVGMTTQEQPSLFWYQSKPSDAKFEITLIQDKKAQPLMRVK